MSFIAIFLEFDLEDADSDQSAARLALCNFEALSIQLNKDSNTPNTTNTDQDEEDADTERIQDELEDATGCITDTIKRFLAQGVANHLPISAYVPRNQTTPQILIPSPC
jgi:hypothetical protein